MPLITRADIEELGLKIGANIPDEEIRRYITMAEGDLDFLPASVVAAFPGTLPAEWASTTAYTTGQKVVYLGGVYEATADSAGVLPTVTTSWKVDKYLSLFHFRVKKWLCYRAYLAMLTWHGVNVGSSGFTTVNESVVPQVDDARRKELRDDIVAELTKYRVLIDRFYSDYYSTSSYCGTDTLRGGGNAWAI